MFTGMCAYFPKFVILFVVLVDIVAARNPAFVAYKNIDTNQPAHDLRLWYSLSRNYYNKLCYK